MNITIVLEACLLWGRIEMLSFLRPKRGYKCSKRITIKKGSSYQPALFLD